MLIVLLTGQIFIVIRNRREHPTEKRDLLSLMLGSKDPVTGEFLSEDAIIKNVSFDVQKMYFLLTVSFDFL